VSQEKLDGEWVCFRSPHSGTIYRCNGILLESKDGDRWLPCEYTLADMGIEFHATYEQAKSTQSVDRISEERDLLRKALEDLLKEAIQPGDLRLAYVAASGQAITETDNAHVERYGIALKAAIEALTKSERGEKE
jgi:hypothetical protein